MDFKFRLASVVSTLVCMAVCVFTTPNVDAQCIGCQTNVAPQFSGAPQVMMGVPYPPQYVTGYSAQYSPAPVAMASQPAMVGRVVLGQSVGGCMGCGSASTPARYFAGAPMSCQPVQVSNSCCTGVASMPCGSSMSMMQPMQVMSQAQVVPTTKLVLTSVNQCNGPNQSICLAGEAGAPIKIGESAGFYHFAIACCTYSGEPDGMPCPYGIISGYIALPSVDGDGNLIPLSAYSGGATAQDGKCECN